LTTFVDGIQFIDFEYGSYNYRGYDIANHFCEFPGFECDWKKFPSKETQCQWLAYYLQHGKLEMEEILAECLFLL
jgi:ethanolamine kinase